MQRSFVPGFLLCALTAGPAFAQIPSPMRPGVLPAGLGEPLPSNLLGPTGNPFLLAPPGAGLPYVVDAQPRSTVPGGNPYFPTQPGAAPAYPAYGPVPYFGPVASPFQQ